MKSVFLRLLLIFFISVFARPSLAEKVFQFSAAVTGNGFNWSGTMGWMAENLNQVATQARQYQKQTGTRAYILISSSAGASSGAAISLLIDSALNNPSLVETPGNRMLSPDEVDRVAEMIRFVGIGSDYKFWDGVKAVSSVFSDWTKALLKRIDRWVMPSNQASEIYVEDTSDHVPIRKGLYFASRKYAIRDFGKLFAFVRRIDFNAVHIPIKDFPEHKYWQDKAQKSEPLKTLLNGVGYVSDLANTTSVDLKSADKSVREFIEWQKKQARTILLAHTKNIEVESVLKESVGDGVFTFALGQLYNVKDAGKLKTLNPTMDQLRGVVFVNKVTAESILASSLYRDGVIQEGGLISRYIIAVVENRMMALNNSIQEPGLFEALDAKLNSPDLGISEVYIPERDVSKNFRLEKADIKEIRLNVVGGFPYQPIVSLLQPMFNEFARSEITKNSPNFEISPYHFTLSNKWDPADPKQFPIQVVRKVFSGEYRKMAIESNPYVQGFLTWNQNAEKWQKQTIEKINGIVYESQLHWDLSLLPARLVGLGHKLALDGRRAAQAGLVLSSKDKTNSCQSFYTLNVK